MSSVRIIHASVIPAKFQRYDTVGDWLFYAGSSKIVVNTSDMGDWRMNMACILHELVEAALCVNDGVDEETVSQFDRYYEDLRRLLIDAERIRHDVGTSNYDRLLACAKDTLRNTFGCDCTPTEDSEPGEDLHAPYRKQHAVADVIERLFAHEIGVPWASYQAAAEKASDEYNA